MSKLPIPPIPKSETSNLRVVSINNAPLKVDEPSEKMIEAGIGALKGISNNTVFPIGMGSIVRLIYRAMRASR